MFNPAALRALFARSGLTEERLGERLGVSQTKVSKWLNGKDLDSGKDRQYQEPLAKLLKATVEELDLDGPRRSTWSIGESLRSDHVQAAEDISVEQRLTIARVKAEAAQARASQERARKEAKPKKENPRRKESVAKAMATREAKEYLARVWYDELGTVFGVKTVKAAWSKSDGGRVTSMLASKTIDELEPAFRYTVRNWKEIGPRFFKDRSTPLPTIAFVDSFIDNMVQESKGWNDSSGVEAEWDAWWKDHPYEQPPEELQKRYEEAIKRR